MNNVPARLTAALADRYRVERELGAGGMATVYLAHDLKHERDVAIKVLHPDLGAALGVERFLSEIRTTARLQHPHILPLLDSGEADGLLYYVMPLVTGETLRARLERERQLPIADALRIAHDVADALSEAHSKGVVHRDIKPENILLQSGRAVVADFGIALAVQSAGGQRMTQTGLSLGTPQYMAPEQAMGERTIDARADVYALGAVTYEMLTGDPPFTGSSVQAIVARVLTERPVSPRSVRDTVPVHVERAVLAALAKLPADRLPTAQAFAEALSGARVLDAAPDPFEPRGGAALSRAVRGWQAMAGTATLVAIGAAVYASRAAAPVGAPVLQQFDLTLPDSVQLFNGAGRKISITPDGRRMVFVGSRSGVPGLYVRDRDQREARLIAGTAGIAPGTAGFSPSISPDGAWVVFTEALRIVRVPVAGGQRDLVSDSGTYGVYVDSQTVLCSSGRSLWLVPAAGGAHKALARGDTTRGERALVWPAPLPGGTHALITINHSVGATVLDSLSLGVVDLRTGERVDTRLYGTNPVLVNGEWLLYGQPRGRVAAVRFDLVKHLPIGTPVTILENVWQGTAGAMGFTAADDGVLVYIPTAVGDVASNTVVAVSPAGARRVLPFTSAGDRLPRVSPDGRWIALFARFAESDRYGSELLDVKTGARAPLIKPGEGVTGFWMADSKRLVFVRPWTTGVELVLRTVDGSAPDSVVARLPYLATNPTGNAARGISVIERNSDYRLLLARSDSLSGAQPIATGRGRTSHPALSPDGLFVAYTSDESSFPEVYVQPIAGPGGRLRVSVRSGSEPLWGPDGRTLFFRGSEGVMRATLNASRAEVDRLDILFPDVYDRTTGYRKWDLMPSGEFLFTMVPQSLGRAQAVVNWQALLTQDPARRE